MKINEDPGLVGFRSLLDERHRLKAAIPPLIFRDGRVEAIEPEAIRVYQRIIFNSVGVGATADLTSMCAWPSLI